MLSGLTQDHERNRLVCSEAAQHANNGGGIPLVLSDRKAHCQAIAEALDRDYGITPMVFNRIPPHKLPEPIQRALSSVEVQDYPDGSRKYKYRLWDKGRSLERVSKHLGLYEKNNRQQGPSLQKVFASVAEHNPELAVAIRARLEEHASG